MKATQFFLIGALALALTGCGAKREALYDLYAGEPTAEQCQVIAEMGDDTVKVGDKAETAKEATSVALPLLGKVGAAIVGVFEIALNVGEKAYDTTADKYREKCVKE